MHLRSFSKTAVSMLAVTLVGALLVVGCSDDDDNSGGNGGGGGDPAVIGSQGHRFVGDWRPEYNSQNSNFISIISLNSSGEFYWTHFQKVDNFWIAGRSCDNGRDGCTWSADDKYLYNSVDGEDGIEYRLSGNTLTIFGCYYDEEEGEEDCFEEVWIRGGSRPSGTIHNTNPALNGSWRMGNSYLWFYGIELDFWGVDYFDDYHDYDIWYTNGNRLFMLGVSEVPNSCQTFTEEYNCGGGQICTETWEDDCAYTVAETVEFTYTHVPRSTLRLVNTSRGIDDTWEYDEYDYYKRRDNSENGKRQNPFRRSQSHRALSKR